MYRTSLVIYIMQNLATPLFQNFLQSEVCTLCKQCLKFGRMRLWEDEAMV